MQRRIIAIAADSSPEMSRAVEFLRTIYSNDLETIVEELPDIEALRRGYESKPNVADLVFIEDKGDLGTLPNNIGVYYAIGRSKYSRTTPMVTPEKSMSMALDTTLEDLSDAIEKGAGRAYNNFLREERGQNRTGIVTLVGATGVVGNEVAKNLGAKFLHEDEGRVIQVLQYGNNFDEFISRLRTNTEDDVMTAYDKGIIRVVNLEEMLDTSQVIVYVPSVTRREVSDRYEQFKLNWTNIFDGLFAEEAKHPSAPIPYRIVGSGYGESISRMLHEREQGKRFPMIAYNFASHDAERVRAVLKSMLKRKELDGVYIDVSSLDDANVVISGTHRATVLLPDNSYFTIPDGNGGTKVSFRSRGMTDDHVRAITRGVQESARGGYALDESPQEFIKSIPFTLDRMMNKPNISVMLSVPFERNSKGGFGFHADQLWPESEMAITPVLFKDPAKPKPLFRYNESDEKRIITLSEAERSSLYEVMDEEDFLHKKAVRELAHAPQ